MRFVLSMIVLVLLLDDECSRDQINSDQSLTAWAFDAVQPVVMDNLRCSNVGGFAICCNR